MIKLKRILTENENNYKIYCDLDGVLVAFLRQVKNLFNIDFIHSKNKKSVWVQSIKYGPEFWSSMDMMDDGQELWDYIKKYNAIILSATPFTDVKNVREYATIGKNEWVKNHLGNVNVILTNGSKEKILYAKPNRILIDDLESNVTDWTSKGGIGILHISTQETIKQLQQILGSTNESSTYVGRDISTQNRNILKKSAQMYGRELQINDMQTEN